MKMNGIAVAVRQMHSAAALAHTEVVRTRSILYGLRLKPHASVARPQCTELNMLQCFVTTAVGIDVIAHGATIGYPAVLLPQLDKTDSIIKLTEDDASWIASVLGIAMLVGIFLTPPIMGRLGRKVAHYIAIVPMLVSWLMFSTAYTVKELIIARILQGLSYGMFTPLRSILIGEYTSPKNRGAFLTTISLTQGSGVLFVHVIGSLLSWQHTALVLTLFPFVSLIMTIYSPESPSWLADRGEFEKCKQAFFWLRSDKELYELEEMVEARLLNKKPKDEDSFWRNLFKIMRGKEFFKPIIVMVHLYLMMAFAGTVTLPAYATQIISSTIGSNSKSEFWMITLDSQRLVTNMLTVYVMNKVKRRKMFFVTIGACLLSHLLISVYIYSKGHGYLKYDAIWLPLLLLNLQYFSVGAGMVALPVALAGELFPIAYRSIGGCISAAFYSGFTFLALKTFCKLVDNVGLEGTYLIYVFILMYVTVVIFFMLPETKGRTLQQIENKFKGVTSITECIEAKRISKKQNGKNNQTILLLDTVR